MGQDTDLNERLEHVATWDTDITDDEIRALSRGVSPLLIRPDHLLEYNNIMGVF